MKISTDKIPYTASVAAMLLVWEALSLWFDSPQILPGPVATLVNTGKLLFEKTFINTVIATLLRALIGFTAAFVTGIALGVAGGLSKGVDSVMKPWIAVMRSTPVIAFILLALIWFRSGSVPVVIAFLTTVPLIYTNTLEGIKATDTSLLQMASLYRVPPMRCIRDIYLPSAKPYIGSAAVSATGFGWKAVITGEVLSQPLWGIGSMMKNAQSLLQVEVLVGWTLIAVMLSTFSEKLLRRIFR